MRIEIMSRRGDEVFAEWSGDTPAVDLEAIAARFQAQRTKGFRAFGAVSGRRVDVFDAAVTEDLVFIAPVVGG